MSVESIIVERGPSTYHLAKDGLSAFPHYNRDPSDYDGMSPAEVEMSRIDDMQNGIRRFLEIGQIVAGALEDPASKAVARDMFEAREVHATTGSVIARGQEYDLAFANDGLRRPAPVAFRVLSSPSIKILIRDKETGAKKERIGRLGALPQVPNYDELRDATETHWESAISHADDQKEHVRVHKERSREIDDATMRAINRGGVMLQCVANHADLRKSFGRLATPKDRDEDELRLQQETTKLAVDTAGELGVIPTFGQIVVPYSPVEVMIGRNLKPILALERSQSVEVHPQLSVVGG